MGEVKDKGYDKKYIDEVLSLADINSFLKDNITYSFLNDEDKVKVCLTIYDKYLKSNVDKTSVRNYLNNNLGVVLDVLGEVSKQSVHEEEVIEPNFMEKNWDTIDEITNYLVIDSMLQNNEIYSNLSYHPKSAAVLAIYNSYCNAFVDEDITTDYMIETYIRDNRCKVEKILKYIQDNCD